MEKYVIWLWVLSFLVSISAVAAISYKWAYEPRSYGADAHVIRNESQLEDFLLRHHNVAQFKTGHGPYRVPTGFFIQSLAFVTATDVNVTGFIWQAYPEDYPKDFVKGVVFAEQVDSANTVLTKSYASTRERDGVEYDVIGWYFDVTIRQTFDYSHYPLDSLTVWLRLWPKQLSDDILLVPDFHSYKKTDNATFGLDFEIVHGEWEVDETFFSYKEIPYDTNFGYGPGFEPSADAEDYRFIDLYFNLGLHRRFMDAFIINLVPLFVMALLLFAQLLTVSRKKDLAEHLGFSITDSIATYSAVFFVILLAHVQVRSQFAGSGLVYMEYFYLIMYLVIFLSVTNTFIFVFGKSRYTNGVRYRDNLLPKLLYWPGILWMMAAVTWLSL